MSTTRFGISLDGGLLRKFDQLIRKKGYAARSEAIRDLIRNALVKEEWEAGTAETAGTITLVYAHDTRELTDTLTELQHRHHHAIVSALHVHLDAHNCLEVLVVRGRGRELRRMADRLIGTRGVKHGTLTVATTGRDMA
jgi:CopG family nickel-responsive transcriptional regulator